MSNAEKLEKTMKKALREYQKLPEYLKQPSSRPNSASIYSTVRPTSKTKKR
jgi:hypothetical protein